MYPLAKKQFFVHRMGVVPKYTTPPVGALVLDSRMPLDTIGILIFLIILLILLNYMAIIIDKFNQHLLSYEHDFARQQLVICL